MHHPSTFTSEQSGLVFKYVLLPVRTWSKTRLAEAHLNPILRELLDWVLEQLVDILVAPSDDVIQDAERHVLSISLQSLTPEGMHHQSLSIC
jgi:hypothetical protein